MDRKTHFLRLFVLAIIMLTTTVSYAQGWGEILLGVGSALLENHIDKSSSYSSQEKESMKSNLNTINNAVNTNQNARNATRDATQGNYTGAVIQGAQTIMNATGNYQYDTYLNSANQINNANREYKQDIKNGMDQQEALNKRNTTIGYSAAESAIELQDRIAQERAEKNRQQREAERQIQESYNYTSEPTYGTSTSTDTRNTTSTVKAKSISSSNSNSNSNSNSKLLTKNQIVKFTTDEGTPVALGLEVDEVGTGGYQLFYNNLYNDRKVRLSCNNVSIKVKYVDDDIEQTFTDACSFVMPANKQDYIKLSDIFFSISETQIIENIKILFVDAIIE